VNQEPFDPRGDPAGFYFWLDAAGAAVLKSTYLGGNTTDGATGIALVGNNSLYVAGWSTSTNLPTDSGSYQQTNHGQRNGFISQRAPEKG
jgi:hypothetical protein